jgi:glycosyltransferase
MVRFSIITCVKNNELDIGRCLQSVDALLYDDYEHIILDGNSVDQTLKVVHQHASIRSRIFSQHDTGLYNALNAALKLAKGQYIILLHADDTFMSPSILTELEKCLVDENFPDAVLCNITITDKTGKLIRKWNAKTFEWAKIKYGWCPPHTGLVIGRNVYDENLPYSEDFLISSDYDFIVRLLTKQLRYTFFEKNLVNMRIGGMSTSIKNYKKTLVEDMRIANLHELSFIAPFLKRIFKIGQFF